jgi:hypothetical protein
MESGKIGMTAISRSAKLFFLHKHQMNSSTRARLNFRIKRVQKASNPALYFIIVYKPYKETGIPPMISPEIVQGAGGLVDMTGYESMRKRREEDEKSSIEDFETDFGEVFTPVPEEFGEQGYGREERPRKREKTRPREINEKRRFGQFAEDRHTRDFEPIVRKKPKKERKTKHMPEWEDLDEAELIK